MERILIQYTARDQSLFLSPVYKMSQARDRRRESSRNAAEDWQIKIKMRFPEDQSFPLSLIHFFLRKKVKKKENKIRLRFDSIYTDTVYFRV